MNAFLEGSLEGLPLSSVIRLLASSGREGVIRIGGPDRSAELHLRSGPRFAMRSDDPDFQLPRLLVRREVISPAEGAKLNAAMQTSGGPLENSSHFSAEELRNFGRLQAIEILIDALTWDSGQFRWTDDLTMPAGLGLFELDVADVEQEASRRSAEAAIALKPDEGTRFKVMSDSIPATVTLAADELKLLLAIGQERSFGELAGSGMLDEQEASRLVHRLRVRGLIEESATSPAKEASAPPENEAARVEPEPLPPPAEALPEQETQQPAAEQQEAPPAPPSLPQADRPIEATAHDRPMDPEVSADTSADTELPFAVLTLDDDAKTSYPLLDGQTSIGRSEHNTVRIVHGSISGSHARVDRTQAGYRLEDLKSRNGTFVNGDRIESALLKNNDRIRLGTVYLTFSVAAELEPSATVMTKLPDR